MHLTGKNSRRNYLWSLVFISGLLLPYIVPSPYHMRVINTAGVFAITTLGLNFITGYTGQINMAQSAFCGIGAYTSALVTLRAGLSFWIALPLAGFVAALCGLLVGLPTLRLRDFYLAIGTIAFARIIQLLMINLRWLTGGPAGIREIPVPTLGGLIFDSDVSYFYLIYLCVCFFMWFSTRIENSRLGRAMKAVRESEVAAQCMGIDVAATKLVAIGLSAFMAGVAGSLYAHLFTYISPDNFSFFESVQVLVMLYAGGSGTVMGPVLGAVVLTLLPEWLRFVKQYYMAFYGLGIVTIFRFAPTGLLGLLERFCARTRGATKRGLS